MCEGHGCSLVSIVAELWVTGHLCDFAEGFSDFNECIEQARVVGVILLQKRCKSRKTESKGTKSCKPRKAETRKKGRKPRKAETQEMTAGPVRPRSVKRKYAACPVRQRRVKTATGFRTVALKDEPRKVRRR